MHHKSNFFELTCLCEEVPQKRTESGRSDSGKVLVWSGVEPKRTKPVEKFLWSVLCGAEPENFSNVKQVKKM